LGSELGSHKKIPGVSPLAGKILLGAFLFTCFFTAGGITLINEYFFAVSDALSVLLIIALWVLFLLLLSATMFWRLLKGIFF